MSIPTQAEQTLYDDFVRTDPYPAGASESSFDFINRVDQPFWRRVRETTESWFAEFPLEHCADLRSRYRKADANQHWPAWWELYLFTLFRRMGFTVEVHPDLEGSGNHPDFLISLNGSPVAYVEAACANTGAIIATDRHTARESRLIDIINEVPHRGFYVSFEVRSTGPADLRRKFVRGEVEDWVERVSAGDGRDLVIDRDGWVLRLSALTSGDRTQDRPLISMGPFITGTIDDIGALRSVAERKRGHYPVGDLPLVLALLQKNDPSDEACVDRLLFGDRLHGGGRIDNGLWSSPSKLANPKPDALLVANSIHPWTAAKRVPALVAAPGREEAVSAIRLPETLEEADDGLMASELLGLPTDWPGPEESFVGL